MSPVPSGIVRPGLTATIAQRAMLLRLLPAEGRGVGMTVIYVDADACPVREEIYRVAGRLRVAVRVVSNGSRPIRPPGLPDVEMVVVASGPDAADDWIAERIGAGDLCATADIPLAARCLARGARALAFNGREWTTDNIGGALAGRTLSQHLRETGVATGGPAALTPHHRSAFLDALDRLVHAASHGRPARIGLRSPEID